MHKLTDKHQPPARCSTLLLSKKYTMAFKELEHRDHWLGLQTIGLYAVLFLLLPLAPTCAVSALEQGSSFCSVILLGYWSLNIVCEGTTIQMIK